MMEKRMMIEYIKKSEIPNALNRDDFHEWMVKTFLASGEEGAKITFESVVKAKSFSNYVHTKKSKTAVKAAQKDNFVYLWKDEEVES